MARPRKQMTNDTAAEATYQSGSIILPSTGDVPDVKAEIIDAAQVSLQDDYAAALAFNEEVLEVLVHDSSDPNAELIVETGVNGTMQRFIRGVPCKAKRKYVERLARAVQVGVTTSTGVNPHTLEAYTKIDTHPALKYPFSVLQDPNPKGVAWLKKLTQRGA